MMTKFITLEDEYTYRVNIDCIKRWWESGYYGTEYDANGLPDFDNPITPERYINTVYIYVDWDGKEKVFTEYYPFSKHDEYIERIDFLEKYC